MFNYNPPTNLIYVQLTHTIDNIKNYSVQTVHSLKYNFHGRAWGAWA